MDFTPVAYRHQTHRMKAMRNEYNHAVDITIGEETITVPAGWALVQWPDGSLSMLQNNVIADDFVRDEEMTPMESFVNTVVDLRNNDRGFELRIAALEESVRQLLGPPTECPPAPEEPPV